jgi:hypothetical protein
MPKAPAAKKVRRPVVCSVQAPVPEAPGKAAPPLVICHCARRLSRRPPHSPTRRRPAHPRPQTPTKKAAKPKAEKKAKKEKVWGPPGDTPHAAGAPPLPAPCAPRHRAHPFALPPPALASSSKDPNAPKRALGAYMFFSADKRGEVRAARGLAAGRPRACCTPSPAPLVWPSCRCAPCSCPAPAPPRLHPHPQIKAKNPSFGVADIAKELGVAWKKLTDKEKSKYEELAKKDKERYEKEKAKYEKSK